MPTVLRPATFSPVLLESKPLVVSQEQKNKVRDVLDVGASDSRFAQKMYDAVYYILTAGSAVPPVLTSLSPDSVVLGSPSFTLNIIGTGFKQGSVIYFNGGEEPTTVVSATHLTTGVDMSTAGTAVSVPVTVLNPDGVMSDPMMFEFIADAPSALSAKKSVKEDPHPHVTMEAPSKKLAVEEHYNKDAK